MKSALTCLLALLALSAASGQAPAPLRILCLGDSYTIGEGVTEEERWPNQLAELLRTYGHATAPPQIIAATGWTSADLHRAMSRASIEPPYDYVTLLIGVNDQYQGVAASAYLDRFQRLLADATGLADGKTNRVIVLSIPDYSVTPFAERLDIARIRRELDHFNLLNREAARVAGAHYLDITASAREVAANPGLLAADGLHPSPQMYEEWARQVLNVIRGERGTP